MKKRNMHIGSSLEDFLKEEGVLEETRAVALKETLAWQVQQAMEKSCWSQPFALCTVQELLPARHLLPMLYTDCSVVDIECLCCPRIAPCSTL